VSLPARFADIDGSYDKDIYPNRAESPSKASSSFFSFFSSSFGAPVAAYPPPVIGGATEEAVGGVAFKASSMFTSLKAATSAFILTSSGVAPVAFMTFLTLSSVISCFNLCNNNAA